MGLNLVRKEDVTLRSGASLQYTAEFQEYAQEVSDWLAASVPNTQPKTIDTLIAHAENSVYALRHGRPIGHVAVKSLGFVGSSTQVLPHFRIESLVVDPVRRGSGLGKLLIARACQDVAQQTDDVALVSAWAACASLPIFQSYDFAPNPELGVPEQRQDEKALVSRLLFSPTLCQDSRPNMVGNSMSDWVEPNLGVRCAFVGEARINPEAAEKAFYASDQPHIKGVIDFLERLE